MSFPIEDNWHDDERPRQFGGWLLGLLILSLLVAAWVFYFSKIVANRQTALSFDDVTAIESRFTLEADGHHLTSIDREKSPEVWYRVTLNHAPLGTQLMLHCDWVDPVGQIAHQNHYRTRVIDKEIWPTHARYRFGPESAVGKWVVRLLLEGRVLGSATLEVRDGHENAAATPILEKIGEQ